ncbi:MAG TPA: DMT family transporter [Chryseolinea sp.]|nr:DMT family transporter [Chryseolinea sp.]
MATGTDYLKLHFIVFLWGFSAILGKLVSLPAVEMVFYRTILAAVGMGIVMLATKGSFEVNKSNLIKLVLIGFIVAFHWVAFFASARIANVSVSLVGFATNSLWAALLEPWFNKNRIKKFELMLGLIVLFGLYVIFSFDFQYKLGLFVGVTAGFTSALFSVFNAKMVRHVPAYTITFYEMIGAFVGLALFFPLYKITWAPAGILHLLPSTMDWVYIALLAGVCSVYAYSTAVELMKKISVFMIQLALNLEPIYGIIMAVIIFGSEEKMGASFYVGALIIMTAVVLYPVLKKRHDRTITFNA